MMKQAFWVFASLFSSNLMAATPVLASGKLKYKNVEHLDALWNQTLIELWIIGLVFSIVALYWLFKYRAKHPDDVGQLPKLTKGQAVAWIIIPAAVFLAVDFFMAAKGWAVWNEFRRVPEDAMEVKVTGSQWYWEFEYEGELLSEELVVPAETPIVLRMTASDVIHSFFIPDFRVKEDLMPGRVTYLWFYPDKPGEHVATCAEYCGTAHAGMWTTVRVVSQKEYDAWYAELVKENS